MENTGKTMEIVYKKLNELIPYDKNPRDNDRAVQYVADSIKAYEA